MRSTLVYDLPTRIFHWVFSSLFLITFFIAKTVKDESIVFSYHSLLGLLLGALVLWRIFWGFFGSKHAKFSGFCLNLAELKSYLSGIVSGSKKRWPGHNPASSWAAVAMFALTLGLASTGYLMTTGNKELFEDVHELLANTFIVIAVLHISGVLLHSARHRDTIALSMVDGKKELSGNEEAIASSKPLAGIILVALIFSASIYIYKNFNPQNKTLSLLGNTLQLGEQEHENEGKDGANTNEENDDDDD